MSRIWLQLALRCPPVFSDKTSPYQIPKTTESVKKGEMTKTDGGFLVSAKKAFASQSILGDIVVTSAPYFNPQEGWQVLHFPVPMKADGVSILDDWDVMGMRATGSQTIVFNKVFVPDSAIVLSRARNGFHAVWDVAITVAMPLIWQYMSALPKRHLQWQFLLVKNIRAIKIISRISLTKCIIP